MSCVYPLIRYFRGDEEDTGEVRDCVGAVRRRRAGGVVVISSAGRLFLPYATIGADGRIQLNIEHDERVFRLEMNGVVGIHTVTELLRTRYAIITGGRSGECPILTFPDSSEGAVQPPRCLSDDQFRQLIIYLTSLPPLQDADCGFVLVIDRRRSGWSSLKATLLQISFFFPGVISTCFVMRPRGFLQGAWSDMNFKLIEDVVKFKVVFCSSLEHLHSVVDSSQLTEDLGGAFPHCHDLWISQRIEVERFTMQSHNMSSLLEHFCHQLDGTDLPRDGKMLENVLKSQESTWSLLKNDLNLTSAIGESLLSDIRLSSLQRAARADYSPERLINVTTVERLLVQLEETGERFDNLWQKHNSKVHRLFDERRFNELCQQCQDQLTSLMSRCVLPDASLFSPDQIEQNISLCQSLQRQLLETNVKVAEAGRLAVDLTSDLDSDSTSGLLACCRTLRQSSDKVASLLSQNLDLLSSWRSAHKQLDQISEWCSLGMEILACQSLEKASSDGELAGQWLQQLQQLLQTAQQFRVESQLQHELMSLSSAPAWHQTLLEVVQRFDNVYSMGVERSVLLRRTVSQRDRPVLLVPPAPAKPLDKVNARPSGSVQRQSSQGEAEVGDNDDASVAKCGAAAHKLSLILDELIDTERVYVSELQQIVTGYLNEMRAAEERKLLHEELCGQCGRMFGNLGQVYEFHRDVLLPALENDSRNVQSVGDCLFKNKARINTLYVDYCLNMFRSESLLKQLGDFNPFLYECQKQLQHQLPLRCHLIKPVQRITKYQLLLKDLLNHTEDPEHQNHLREALSCMLAILKSVNDSMFQAFITRFPGDFAQLGRLLLHSKLLVSCETKKDMLKELRTKPKQRHMFLYEKAILFCKEKRARYPIYIYKSSLQMADVGLTECLGADGLRFELWLPARATVYTLTVDSSDERQRLVTEIKRVLMEQLTKLRGEVFRPYAVFTPISTASAPCSSPISTCGDRAASLPEGSSAESGESRGTEDGRQSDAGELTRASQSTFDSSDDEEDSSVSECKRQDSVYSAIADYRAHSVSHLSVRQGDLLRLLEIGDSGLCLMSTADGSARGWVPFSFVLRVEKRHSHGSQSVSSADTGQ